MDNNPPKNQLVVAIHMPECMGSRHLIWFAFDNPPLAQNASNSVDSPDCRVHATLLNTDAMPSKEPDEISDSRIRLGGPERFHEGVELGF